MAATFRTADANSNTYARFPVQIINKVITFVNADGTTAKQIAVPDTTVLGSRITKILVSTTETSSNKVKFYLHDGTSLSTLPIFFADIAAFSGDGSTAANAVSVLRASNVDPFVDLDNNGNTFLALSRSYSLYAAPNTTVASTKTLQISIWIEDY